MNIRYSAKKYRDFNYFSYIYIGRKYNFLFVYERTLKLNRAGDMKHKRIAMIDENFPTVAITPVVSVYEKMLSNVEGINVRRKKIIVIHTGKGQ